MTCVFERFVPFCDSGHECCIHHYVNCGVTLKILNRCTFFVTAELRLVGFLKKKINVFSYFVLVLCLEGCICFTDLYLPVFLFFFSFLPLLVYWFGRTYKRDITLQCMCVFVTVASVVSQELWFLMAKVETQVCFFAQLLLTSTSVV